MVTLNTSDKVGPFVLVEKLGEGGFAEVWKAERPDAPGKFEALKIPTDPEFAKQLRTEDRIRRGLDHPNIVRLLGEDLDSDPPYLRMEFVNGQSLEALLQKNGSLPVKDALDIAEQVAQALDHAHSQKIVHADVKPSNILIDREGVARLTDFGLGFVPREVARSVLKSAAQLSDEKSRSIAGTFDYMAPEQRTGETIDPRADLYALGRVLYRMLTGSLPSGLRLPSEAKQGVPTTVDGLVARLLEDRECRTASAGAFLVDLEMSRREGAHPSRAAGSWKWTLLGCVGAFFLLGFLAEREPGVFGAGSVGSVFATLIIFALLGWTVLRAIRQMRGRPSR